MTCVEFEARLQVYVDGELSVELTADGDAHAAECGRCAALARGERAYRALLRRQARAQASLRILVIDDDQPIREVIADLLREDGHHVEEVGHGRDGLARLRNGGPLDLVITDLGMPEVTGWDIIRAAKDHRPPLPTGLVTGWGDDPDGRPADCSRPDFVLAKPVSHAALRLALGRIAPRTAK